MRRKASDGLLDKMWLCQEVDSYSPTSPVFPESKDAEVQPEFLWDFSVCLQNHLH